MLSLSIDLVVTSENRKNPATMWRPIYLYLSYFYCHLLAIGRNKRTWKISGVLLAGLAIFMATSRLATWATLKQMAFEIRTSDDSTAARLVRQLPPFGKQAYPALMDAANSKRSAVALAARDEVDQLVDEWQQAVFLHPATFELNDRPLPLAANIERELPTMTPSGRHWARLTLMALLDLARKQDFTERLELIQLCDRALSSLPADDPQPGFEPDVEYKLTLAPPPAEVDRTYVAEPRSMNLLPVPVEISLNDPPPLPPNMLEMREEQIDLNEPAPLELSDIPAPLMPVSDALIRQWHDMPITPEEEAPATAAEEQQLTDRTLFKLLSKGAAPQQQAAAQALAQRGYGDVSPLDARMMVSPSTNDRVALIDRVLTSPHLEAEKWLWQLAHDSAGEVRAAAISAISTSGNAELIAAAYDLVLHDTDPRVAQQAPTLQGMLR